MISRRVIRIKVLQILYSYSLSKGQALSAAESELFFSFQKTYELYHYLLLLLVDVSHYARTRIEHNMQKHVPSHEDLNPNRKFIENKVIGLIEQNAALQAFVQSNKLSWANYPELIRGVYNDLLASEAYKTYMESSERSMTEDMNFFEQYLYEVIGESELLYQILEEQSIYWNDDLEFVISMIFKTVSKFDTKQPASNKLLPLFKNNDDINFAKQLFRKSVVHYDEYRSMIEKFTQNWDIERIAFTDFVIMVMAIAETLEFDSIPTKVSLNEYIEISKFYSTEKSSTFINGILDKVVQYLKKENRLVKAGRGLIGEEL